MQIDPGIEEHMREMLGHAMRQERDELTAQLYAEREQTVAGAIVLCMVACGYVCIDVTGNRWPSQTMLQKIAHNASTAATHLDVSEEDIFAYLSRCVFGSEGLPEVFEREAVAWLPFFILANLLATFRPKEVHWLEYLDRIWDANNAADMIDKAVLPALMFQVRKDERAPAD
jgi:hypothetical protein